MKKVLFTIGMIAILVGAAFAGMAASSSQPQVPWNSLEQEIGALSTQVTALNAKVTSIEGNLTTVKNVVNNIAGAITPIGAVVQEIRNNLPKMETYSGNVTVEYTGQGYSVVALDVPYDQVRHVSLSLDFIYIDQLAPTQGLSVQVYVGDATTPIGLWGYVPTLMDSANNVTLDFSTNHWQIVALNEEASPFVIYYSATVTYVPLP